MTLDQPGPALDAWIAERVMGAKRVDLGVWENGVPRVEWRYPNGDARGSLPTYSDWIGFAWPVWERVTAKRPDLVLGRCEPGDPWKAWVIRQNQGYDGHCIFGGGEDPCEADTAPLAICLAAQRVFA